MNARAALSAVLFAISLLLAPVSLAHAGAWSLKPGEYFTEFLAGWSSSDFYHDQNGDKRPLARGGLWEERSLLSYSELGWKPKLSFLFGLPARSVTRRFGAAAGGRTVPTATGLSDALVGFRWNLANGRTAATVELDWNPPLGYERDQFLTHADSVAAGDSNGDGDSLDVNRARQLGSPVLGDGQNDVTLSLHAGTALMSRGFLQVSGGYKYRFENPLDQIVASADLGLWITRSLMLAGRYQGEIAASEGEVPTSNPDRHRAGPMLVYRLDGMDLLLASMHTAAATNALHTDEVFVGVAFRQTKLNRLQGFLGGSSNP